MYFFVFVCVQCLCFWVCVWHTLWMCVSVHIYVCVLACIGWRRGSLVGQSCSSHAWRCLMHRWTCAIVFDWPHCSRWSYLSLPPDTRASLAAYLLTHPPSPLKHKLAPLSTSRSPPFIVSPPQYPSASPCTALYLVPATCHNNPSDSKLWHCD